MDEYGLVLEPEYPNEAFEALSDTMGDRVFTRIEAVDCIRDILDISDTNALTRFNVLVRNSNVRELV